MKIFPERVAREQVLWLFGHAVALTVAQVLIFVVALKDSAEIAAEELTQYVLALAGTAAGALVGPAIAVLCVIRAFRPFLARRMRVNMKAVLAVELILWFLSSFILDCGYTQYRVLRLSFAVNFLLLGFVATPRQPDTPADEPS